MEPSAVQDEGTCTVPCYKKGAVINASLGFDEYIPTLDGLSLVVPHATLEMHLE